MEDCDETASDENMDLYMSGNKKKSSQTETETLLERLHLQNIVQQKLSPADFLQIRPPGKQMNHVKYEKDLAHIFLHTLIMLDYRARYIAVRPDSPEVTNLKPSVSDDTEIDDGDLEVFLKTPINANKKDKARVHPMDIQMAVVHCLDSFLKQMIITKLSQCQYALPLLVPDPIANQILFPLWTFREITKTWKITRCDSHIVTTKSVPVYKAETPLVSFFRLGSFSVSKSQLMNTLINNRHDTFFHRLSPGSTKSRYLMDGVAEIAWYCPAGKPTDAFNDCIAFCNLHGDALLIEKQRDILIEKSSINIFLVASLRKNEQSWSLISSLFKSHKPLICLTVDDSRDVFKAKNENYIIGLKDKNHSDVSEDLKKIIREVLYSLNGSSLKPSFQLETMAELSGIRVDETDPACQRGKSAAMEIINLLKNKNIDPTKIKDTFLPCQGLMWHQWSKIHREVFHLRGNIEKDKSKKEEELKKIRQKQCAKSCSKLMELFIGGLSSFPPKERDYFLKWTQIFIDALSTDDISSIRQIYHEKWSEYLALKNKHDKSDLLLKKLKIELDDMSKKLQSVTFGLEHIFREMGQIYESHETTEKPNRHTDWSKYPELAAQLMISGYPMELMDGDAGHVPLTWISSLLEEVIKKLGDQRVFVLSVLGLQSSGKSTMLNTMFGLQFAVSAGRCTKGAFMQLLKISEEMKKDFTFDYILVVDTEGLRALEVEGNTHHHDNELATFVIGLGNLTLINIFGENPSEMQDILEIVVQAFMRMKEVKLSPSCVFVHQNVTDVAAAEKTMDGKRRLQEKLDQMTKIAAEEEGFNAECFSDVIEFDVQDDVKYCAQLWEGSPPMAPPNPGYSESIQEVKNTILSKASKSTGITLTQFKTNIRALWTALLNENFVFSFKNIFEIAVYRKLEVQYGNWTWTLRSIMLTIENQLHNRIQNGKLDEVKDFYLLKETSKTYEEVRQKMTKYFEDDKEREILAHWRGRFEIKIEEFHKEQVNRVKRKLDEVINLKKACNKLDEKKSEFEKKLLQKSKELAQKLKDKAKDEEELQRQFRSVWSGWVTELTADIKTVEDINLEQDQLTILQELGFEPDFIDKCKRNVRYKKISEVGNYSEYMKTSGNVVFETCKKIWSRAFSHEEQQQVRLLINKVEKESLNAITNKRVAVTGYTQTYLREMANHVTENVQIFLSEKKYTLKKEFTVNLLLYVFHRAESWLLESHKKFKMNNDPLTYLENKKTQYYMVFRSFFKENSSAVVLGELICEKLKASTFETACNRTAIDLAGKMRCNFPAFNGNRLNLEKHMLESLAEKEIFYDFITYITNPRRQTEAFIKAEVENYIFSSNNGEAVITLRKHVDDIKTTVSQALFTATEKFPTEEGDTNMWLMEFSNVLKDELTFDNISPENFSDIKDFRFLKEEIEKGLKSNTEQMNILSLDQMKGSRQKPDEILIDQLCNCCWVKCPFCAAVCTNTMKDHSPVDHSTPFHRPDGIKGWHYRDTVELSISFCTTNVASNCSFYPKSDSERAISYKQYKTAGPPYDDWKIIADGTELAYWKWFVCRFQTELEEHYGLKFMGRGEIPDQWKEITKDEAIKSLAQMY